MKAPDPETGPSGLERHRWKIEVAAGLLTLIFGAGLLVENGAPANYLVLVVGTIMLFLGGARFLWTSGGGPDAQ